MSDEPNHEEHEELGEEREDDAMRALLRGALKTDRTAAQQQSAPNLLPSVQRKLRERSRGKFYGDGWSTAQQTTSYLLVAILMLVVLGAAYFALGPMGIGR